MRALLLSAALGAAVMGVNAQQCAVPAKTLSFACGSACRPSEPCLLQAGSSSCALECFTTSRAGGSNYETFSFLIPYDASVGDTASTASKSNSALTKIAAMSLPSATTEVYVPCVLQTHSLHAGADILALYCVPTYLQDHSRREQPHDCGPRRGR